MTDRSIGVKGGIEIIVTDEALMSSPRFSPHLYDITMWKGDYAAFRSRAEKKVYVHPELFKNNVTITRD